MLKTFYVYGILGVILSARYGFVIEWYHFVALDACVLSCASKLNNGHFPKQKKNGSKQQPNIFQAENMLLDYVISVVECDQ